MPGTPNNSAADAPGREGAMATSVPVKGKITGTNGEALAGVVIEVKGTTRTTVSDANGNFTIALDNGE